jgi:hypothetical protein
LPTEREREAMGRLGEEKAGEVAVMATPLRRLTPDPRSTSPCMLKAGVVDPAALDADQWILRRHGGGDQ